MNDAHPERPDFEAQRAAAAHEATPPIAPGAARESVPGLRVPESRSVEDLESSYDEEPTDPRREVGRAVVAMTSEPRREITGRVDHSHETEETASPARTYFTTTHRVTVNNTHPDRETAARLIESGLDEQNWTEVTDRGTAVRQYYAESAPKGEQPRFFATVTQEPTGEDEFRGGPRQIEIASRVSEIVSDPGMQLFVRARGYTELKHVEAIAAARSAETGAEAVVYPFVAGRVADGADELPAERPTGESLTIAGIADEVAARLTAGGLPTTDIAPNKILIGEDGALHLLNVSAEIEPIPETTAESALGPETIMRFNGQEWVEGPDPNYYEPTDPRQLYVEAGTMLVIPNTGDGDAPVINAASDGCRIITLWHPEMTAVVHVAAEDMGTSYGEEMIGQVWEAAPALADSTVIAHVIGDPEQTGTWNTRIATFLRGAGLSRVEVVDEGNDVYIRSLDGGVSAYDNDGNAVYTSDNTPLEGTIVSERMPTAVLETPAVTATSTEVVVARRAYEDSLELDDLVQDVRAGLSPRKWIELRQPTMPDELDRSNRRYYTNTDAETGPWFAKVTTRPEPGTDQYLEPGTAQGEMELNPRTRAIIEGEAVQNAAVQRGFDMLRFVEAAVSVTERDKVGRITRETIVYPWTAGQTLPQEDYLGEPAPGSLAERIEGVVGDVRQALQEQGIEARDLGRHQIMMSSDGRTLYLIDAENYHLVQDGPRVVRPPLATVSTVREPATWSASRAEGFRWAPGQIREALNVISNFITTQNIAPDTVPMSASDRQIVAALLTPHLDTHVKVAAALTAAGIPTLPKQVSVRTRRILNGLINWAAQNGYTIPNLPRPAARRDRG